MTESNQVTMSYRDPRALTMSFRLLCISAGLVFAALPANAQDSGAEGTMLRGDRAELSVTLRDRSGQPVAAQATIRVLREGVPTDQQQADHGRAFFILRNLGNYTVAVDASGYKPVQKELSVTIAVKAEVDIYLQRASEPDDAGVASTKPVLAPKAKEAFDKALKAIDANKMDDADKYLAEALRLAPGHPDVLFVQGVLFLNRRNWPEAQTALEKVTQLDPSNARAFSALGMALNNQNKYADAVPMFEKSVQLDPPGSWETNLALAKAYYYHEQYDQALKTSQQALTESNGKAPQIELVVAQSLTAVGKYEDAAATLRKFLKDHSDRPEAATAKRWLDGLAKNGKIRQN